MCNIALGYVGTHEKQHTCAIVRACVRTIVRTSVHVRHRALLPLVSLCCPSCHRPCALSYVSGLRTSCAGQGAHAHTSHVGRPVRARAFGIPLCGLSEAEPVRARAFGDSDACVKRPRKATLSSPIRANLDRRASVWYTCCVSRARAPTGAVFDKRKKASVRTGAWACVARKHKDRKQKENGNGKSNSGARQRSGRDSGPAQDLQKRKAGLLGSGKGRGRRQAVSGPGDGGRAEVEDKEQRKKQKNRKTNEQAHARRLTKHDRAKSAEHAKGDEN